MERLITSKYSGKCRVCRNGYAVGDRVWWARGGKGAVCMACHDAAPAAPAAPTAPTAPTAAPAVPTAPPNYATTREGSVTIKQWGSFADYVETAKNTTPKMGEHCWQSIKPEFYGTDTWDEAVSLAETGWSEVRPDVDALTEKMNAHIAPKLGQAFTSVFDVAGGSVDIGRFLDGEPECMVETRLVEMAKPGRVVTILVSGGVLATGKRDAIINRGAAIVSLVECIERLQHGTEIWLEMPCSSGEGSKNILSHLVKLKDAGESMDINILLFAIAHPARHRRLTFAIRRDQDYGRYSIPYEATCPLQCAERVGADITLESLSVGDKTRDAETWIRDELSKIGLIRED